MSKYKVRETRRQEALQPKPNAHGRDDPDFSYCTSSIPLLTEMACCVLMPSLTLAAAFVASLPIDLDLVLDHAAAIELLLLLLILLHCC